MSVHQKSQSTNSAAGLSLSSFVLFVVGTAVIFSISVALSALYVSSSKCGTVVAMLSAAMGSSWHHDNPSATQHTLAMRVDRVDHVSLHTSKQQQQQQQQQQSAQPLLSQNQTQQQHEQSALTQNQTQQQQQQSQAPPTMHPMVGYYQCHSRPQAVDIVLQRWRAVYPKAPVFMVNDGGDPSLAELAAKYHCNYTYSTRTSPVTGKAYVRTVEEMQLFMDRIFAVCQYADYVIRVEDDVIMFKPITLATLQYDITGDNPEGLLPPPVVDIVNKARSEAGFANLTQTHYGGFGGTVLRGAFFREMQRQGKYKQHFKALAKPVEWKGSVPLGTSQLLTCLVYMHGGTIGKFPGLVESFYKDAKNRTKAGQLEVLHGDKSHYGNRTMDGMFVGSKGKLIYG